ncbi:MAG: hypothetical protein KME26_03180 [Oscillatoria princeps RMCB-10]|nr:hypothetical protein [Oscillatoria princeps RMCB-10]
MTHSHRDCHIFWQPSITDGKPKQRLSLKYGDACAAQRKSAKLQKRSRIDFGRYAWGIKALASHALKPGSKPDLAR